MAAASVRAVGKPPGTEPQGDPAPPLPALAGQPGRQRFHRKTLCHFKEGKSRFSYSDQGMFKCATKALG
ncbi:hypothetical protein JRQ81_010972 [Phrynocephalus forsythii]|uniref:Uncharacterized protein n=1 Tax=Phrynocephalus forsythii TaxID=171643 RepID=A0A9Q0Y0K5_9SAUR|nr:hypothetical protein JRQ81_010972 [Phrynocephalus forsythii]